MAQEQAGFLRGTSVPGFSMGPLVTESERYAGGLSAATALLTSGTTTVITPSAGKAIKVYWVSAINDPDAALSPLITVNLAGVGNIYNAYAVAHWELFTGSINGVLQVTLDQAGSVAVTVHYKEV